MPQILYPDELQSPELVLEYVEYAQHPFLAVPTFYFRMIEPSASAYAGRINLRVGDGDLLERYAGQVGYQVEEPFRGRRYAARAVTMLKPLAGRLGLKPLWITCDPENEASRRSCELAGGVLVETVVVPEGSLMYEAGARRKCRFRLEV